MEEGSENFVDPKDPKATGRAGGLKSAETRRQKAALRKDQVARILFQDQAEKVAKELLAAALGEGEWAGLDPKDRVGLLKTCLEYGMGRPRPMDDVKPEEPEKPKTGLKFTPGSSRPQEVLETEESE